MDTTRDQLLRDGFVKIKSELPETEIAYYVEQLRVAAAGKARWTQPDGVTRLSQFWPLIFNTPVLAAVRSAFGPDVKFLPHNDLHVGFSSFSWHRDSVNRTAGRGPDWETTDPYQIVRVGFYLQPRASQFKLGLIKGSHHPGSGGTTSDRRRERRTSAVASVLSGLSGVDLVGKDAEWVETDPGDCIVFDPRVLHTGSEFAGEKFAVFVAYGVENSHFRNHWHYYRHLRKDLDYRSLDAALVEQLKTAGLFAEEPPADLEVPDAWIPSSAYTFVAKRFK